jgi:hypothetical protein
MSTPVRIASQWLIVEEEHRVWRFERAFFESRWRCIYGQGCCGIHPSQNPTRLDGCCTYGAHFAEAEDFVKVAAFVPQLTAELWQHRSHASRVGWFKKLPSGRIATRTTRGGCIFLNRPGFSGGVGCALHLGALSLGRRQVDVKPDVCWELPFRTEDAEGVDGRRVITVRRWDKTDFGPEGEDMQWWCTDHATAPEAFSADAPVHVTLRDELVELCGPAVYESLVARLGE